MPTQNSIQTRASFVVLVSRDQYSTTRVWLPDESKPVPAVQIGNQYYSFFRTIKRAHEALDLTAKLCDRNNAVVIIKTPKGYSIWVEEPDAMPQDLLNKNQTSRPANTIEDLIPGTTNPSDNQLAGA